MFDSLRLRITVAATVVDLSEGACVPTRPAPVAGCTTWTHTTIGARRALERRPTVRLGVIADPQAG